MNKIFGLSFLLGVLLASRSVVAGDVSPIATGNRVIANPRHVTTVPLDASATDAVSATTSNFNLTNGAPVTNALPPLPPDVSELKFSEFFRQPIGPRGLEYTDKLRSLEGRRIRILGYMVRQTKPIEHCFLLAARPITVNEAEYGFADDLPAATLHIFTGSNAPAMTAYTPGRLLLTGKLSVGNRVESDGRISMVRLFLDPPTPEQQLAATKAAEAGKSTSSHAGHQH